jgi:hypothetical protein
MPDLPARPNNGLLFQTGDILVSDDRADLDICTVRTVSGRRFQTGVMVVSLSSGKVLYMNQTAHRYLHGQGNNGGALLSIFELIGRMTNAQPRADGQQAPMETTRLRREESFLLLRTFGTYDGEGRMSRVVVTIDETDD